MVKFTEARGAGLLGQSGLAGQSGAIGMQLDRPRVVNFTEARACGWWLAIAGPSELLEGLCRSCGVPSLSPESWSPFGVWSHDTAFPSVRRRRIPLQGTFVRNDISPYDRFIYFLTFIAGFLQEEKVKEILRLVSWSADPRLPTDHLLLI